MKRRLKRLLNLFLLTAMLLPALPVHAENLTGAVVINEIAWMGSAESSTDEWIELHNPIDFDVDISGWSILDDDSTEYIIETGTVEAGGYFLIASKADTAVGAMADAIIPLSLANSGDSLVLNDEVANQIDEVNLSGGAWYAGDNTAKLTMERIDPDNILDEASNWANSKVIGGTPKAANQEDPAAIPAIEITLPDGDIQVGDTLTLTAEISDAKELFAYGMDVNYDPEFLEFQNSLEAEMLSQDGNTTSFQSGLENDELGKLVVGNAIVEDLDVAVDGASGSGTLFTIDFKVLQDGETSVTFSETSFLSNTSEEVEASFAGTGITITAAEGGGGDGDPTLFKITNLEANLSEQQFEFEFSWDDSDLIDKYKILKKNPKGDFEEIAEVIESSFKDETNIVPHVEFEYKIVPYAGEQIGVESLVKITETRGLKGDNDQSNRVDGRDLRNLAESFGSEVEIDSEYSVLNDTNYDAVIDGSDLIDMGANWALTYTN